MVWTNYAEARPLLLSAPRPSTKVREVLCHLADWRRVSRRGCHLVNVDWARRRRYLPTGDSESIVTYSAALRPGTSLPALSLPAHRYSPKPNWTATRLAERWPRPSLYTLNAVQLQQTDASRSGVRPSVSQSVCLSTPLVTHVSQLALVVDWTAAEPTANRRTLFTRRGRSSRVEAGTAAPRAVVMQGERANLHVVLRHFYYSFFRSFIGDICQVHSLQPIDNYSWTCNVITGYRRVKIGRTSASRKRLGSNFCSGFVT